MTRAAAHLPTQPVLSLQIHITSENELFFSLEVFFFFLSVRVKYKSNRVTCLISREGCFIVANFISTRVYFLLFFRGLCV